jgi:hypothetical protein
MKCVEFSLNFDLDLSVLSFAMALLDGIVAHSASVLSCCAARLDMRIFSEPT